MGNDRPLSHPRLNANRVGNPGGACARGKERGRDGRSQALQGGRERERARESKRKPFWKEAKREMEDCGRRKKDGEGDGEM